MNIINNCLLQFKFTLPSELIQERKEEFVSKFACCHSLLWQFGIDYHLVEIVFQCICCITMLSLR